jgi:hypothetical protein
MQQLVFLMFVLVLLWPVAGRSNSHRFDGCLPKEVDPKARIREESSDASSSKSKPKTSVEKKLIELRPSCIKGKLVDKSGKEIRFVHLLGCWGNPPEDYQEQLDKQQAELLKLKEKFTVIEIPCDQGATSSEIN